MTSCSLSWSRNTCAREDALPEDVPTSRCSSFAEGVSPEGVSDTLHDECHSEKRGAGGGEQWDARKHGGVEGSSVSVSGRMIIGDRSHVDGEKSVAAKASAGLCSGPMLSGLAGGLVPAMETYTRYVSRGGHRRRFLGASTGKTGGGLTQRLAC